MPFTRTSFLRTIKIGLAILITLLIVAYALWRSFDYAQGPRITIIEPADGTIISASTTVIRGKVERVNRITLNDKVISVDEGGNFSETLIVFPGTNIITFRAEDQFERSTEMQIQLIRSY